MFKPRKKYGNLVRAKSSLALFLFLTVLIAIFNTTIRSMFRIQRDLIVKGRLVEMHKSRLPELPSTALITMSDPSFQDCMLQLLQSARKIGWKESIYLLAIEYDQFDQEIRDEIDELGAFVINTRPIFDSWVTEKFEGQKSYRRLDPKKFRKMEVFLNPVFRTYERLIYIDADGFLTGLEPMVRVAFPDNVAILMRQNDRSFNKLSFHQNELAEEFLSRDQMRTLHNRYPDRAKSGATAYFIVDVNKLPSTLELFSRSIDILCNFRSAFRLNDQTLLNLLFYDELAMFPYCSWDEVVVMEEPQELYRYCLENMQLQRWLLGQISFMYRHMAVEEKNMCVRKREKGRKRALNDTGNGDSIGPSEALHFELSSFSTCHEAAQAWLKRIPL
ncbi:unnamed protein product [Agarophyton chilense]